MSSPDHDGEVDLSLSKGLSSYLRTRLQLVSIESQEAFEHLKGKIAPLIIALICALVVYLLLVAAVVSLLGKMLSAISPDSTLLGWELAALLVAAGHVFILLKMKTLLTRIPKTPLFEYSRAELERDREWIQDNTPKKKS